jgi:hypothetical protein
MAVKRYRKEEWAQLYNTNVDTSIKDTPSWVITNMFNSSYYSGLDVSIYFGDIYIDEVIALQYQEMEQVRPNFGYESYTMKSVSYGSRMVQGSFTINFKDSGYMHKIIQYLKDSQAEKAKLTQLAKYYGAMSGQNNLNEITRHKAALKGDFTIEDFINGVDNKDNKTSRYASYMDALDAAYWGDYTKQPKRDIQVDETLVRSRSAAYMNRPKFYTTESGIEIIVKYGQPEEGTIDPLKAVPSFGTIEIVKNCFIGSFAKSIDDSGKNVLETYSFIASTIA